MIAALYTVIGFFTIRFTVQFLRTLDDEQTPCGECSDDMGVMFDTWGDVRDIDPANRIYCDRCGR